MCGELLDVEGRVDAGVDFDGEAAGADQGDCGAEGGNGFLRWRGVRAG